MNGIGFGFSRPGDGEGCPNGILRADTLTKRAKSTDIWMNKYRPIIPHTEGVFGASGNAFTAAIAPIHVNDWVNFACQRFSIFHPCLLSYQQVQT